MQFIVIFIFMLFISSITLFNNDKQIYDAVEKNNIVYYVDQLRYALQDIYIQQPNLNKEILFSELTGLPKSIKNRNDIRNFIDSNGIYIVFTKPISGLAELLREKYTHSNSNPDNQSKWDISFYHIGYNKEGCLQTIRYYLYESGDCKRPLPQEIPEGVLVMTDRNAK